MRLIDADAYKSKLLEVLFGEVIKGDPSNVYTAGIGRAIRILSHEPTVDVIPVVICDQVKWALDHDKM